MRLRWTHGCQICSLKKNQKFRTQVWDMTETWIKLCLELNFIQDKGKKCIQMRQGIENFELMQICMRN